MSEEGPLYPTIKATEIAFEGNPLSSQMELMARGNVYEVHSSLRLNQVLETVMQKACEMLRGIGCSIWRIDLETKELVCIGATGFQSELVVDNRLSIQQAIGIQIKEAIIPQLMGTPMNDQLQVVSFRTDLHPVGMESLSEDKPISAICVPLNVDNGFIGILQLTVQQVWTKERQGTLETIADSATLAIRNALSYERLEADAQELLNRNLRLREFITNISHDLRSPLTNLIGRLEIITMLLEKIVVLPNTMDFLHEATAIARRISRILIDLEAYALSKEDIPFEQVDCNEILEEVLVDLEIDIEARKALVRWDILPTIHGARTQIMIVFRNLIANAIKFNVNNVPVINIGFFNREDSWQFFVSDNGIGIAPEDVERIFLARERGENALEYEGTGLGLNICKTIVERHGGEIWVESELGKGSTFFFTISKN